MFLKDEKTSDSDEFYFKVDGHWNEKAHQIIAKYLEKHIPIN